MIATHANLIRRILFAIALTLLGPDSSLMAATLLWDPNSEPGLAGYKVYWGESSRSYSSVVNVGNATSFDVNFLGAGRTYFFAVTAFDTDGLESDFSEEVSYSPPRTEYAPVAVADTYSAVRNGTLEIGAPFGVLANDTDANGDTLTATLNSAPGNGTLVLGSSGGFVYTPNTGFMGNDSFTYIASDGVKQSGVATVTIVVAPPENRAPVANNDTYTIGKNAILVVSQTTGFMANDFDVDGDTLTATLVSAPAHGELVTGTAGGFTYRPQTNYFGTDAFTYQLSDGTAWSSVATVAITITNINRAPVATAEQYAVRRNQALVIAAPGVLANDSDADGTTLTSTLVSAPSRGDLAMSANGSFTYRPATNFVGSDSFSYRAWDGAAYSGTTLVAIAVTNGEPTAMDDVFSTEKNKAITVGPSTGLLMNDADPDGDALVPLVFTYPANGQLTFGGTGGFIYRPATDFVGVDSFTYRVSDGVATSGVATVSIRVTNALVLNREPIASNDLYQLQKNGKLTVNAAQGILANDIDPDSSQISVVIVSLPTQGQLNIDSSGGFTYVPARDFVGIDDFTYRAFDGVLTSSVARVEITVTNAVTGTTNLPPNHAPIAVADQYFGARNSLLTVSATNGVLGNDSDPDGNTIVVALTALPAHGALTIAGNGSFLFMPSADFTGTDAFSYRVSDGEMMSPPVTVTITITNNVISGNHAPIAAGESYTTRLGSVLEIAAPSGVLANDSDADGDQLMPSIVAWTANGTLTMGIDGSFTYSPTNAFATEDTFLYRAWDGAAFSAVVTVTIRIAAADVVSCEDCLLELERFVGNRSVQAPPEPVGQPVTVDEAVATFNEVVRTLGKTGSGSDVQHLMTVAQCLFTVVSNTVESKSEVAARMYPSPWSANVMKVIAFLRKQGITGEQPMVAGRKLVTLARQLNRLDTYLARGNVVPATLDGHVLAFRLAGRSEPEVVLSFGPGTFTEVTASTPKSGAFTFNQTAWDSATLTLFAVSKPPVVYQLQFRSGGGRIKGPLAKGTFRTVQ